LAISFFLGDGLAFPIIGGGIKIVGSVSKIEI
jgi:hypothetical protein